MRMQKRRFRIGELAKQLKVEKFVVRFWEKEFELKTNRSGGGQRFYDEEDVEQFKKIKSLLYEGGFTIAGAKKQLPLKSPAYSVEKITPIQESNHQEFLNQKLLLLQDKLLKLRELL